MFQTKPCSLTQRGSRMSVESMLQHYASWIRRNYNIATKVLVSLSRSAVGRVPCRHETLRRRVGRAVELIFVGAKRDMFFWLFAALITGSFVVFSVFASFPSGKECGKEHSCFLSYQSLIRHFRFFRSTALFAKPSKCPRIRVHHLDTL